MKALGIVRTVDFLGRVCLPKELRKTYGLDNGVQIEIYTDADAIILRKHEPACIFCGNTTNVVRYQNKLVCRDCADTLKDAFAEVYGN